MHPFSVRQLILSSSPQVRESNLGLWIRPRRGFQPRTQASSRYPSYQRRLGTECDRVLGEFPDKLDRWRHIWNRRGRLGTRLRGFQIKGAVFRILYQWLEGFRILRAVFRISNPGIPDSTAKIWCNLDSRSKNFPDSGGAVSSQKQATVYLCSRTNGKFAIEPLKSTCWKISCWLSETLFCRLATYIISSPQRLSIRKIQTVGTLRCSCKALHII